MAGYTLGEKGFNFAMSSNTPRPVYLDLRRIRLPVTGWVSILHRLSGIILFVSTPAVVYLLDLSLRNAHGYAQAAAWLDRGWAQLWAVLVLWSLCHHLAAGVRFLLIDADVGVNIHAARRSARAVIIAGAVAALVLSAVLL